MSPFPRHYRDVDHGVDVSKGGERCEGRRVRPGKFGRCATVSPRAERLEYVRESGCIEHCRGCYVASFGRHLRSSARFRVYVHHLDNGPSARSRCADALPSRFSNGLAGPCVSGRCGRCAGRTGNNRHLGSTASASAKHHNGCDRADLTSDWIRHLAVVARRCVRDADDSDQRNVDADIGASVGPRGRVLVPAVGGDHWDCQSVGFVDRMASHHSVGSAVRTRSTFYRNGKTGHIDSLWPVHGGRHRHCGSSRGRCTMNLPVSNSSFRRRGRVTVRALKKGDASAWSLLVAELGPKITGYANRMGARDGDDVAGATFETLARTIGTFEGSESQLRSYVFSIAHARIVDQLRRSTRRSEVSIENTLVLLEADEPTEETFSDPDLLAALGRLPEDQRRMLDLRYVVGLSTKETARAVGKSEVATRVAISRALSKLKELIVANLREGGDDA